VLALIYLQAWSMLLCTHIYIRMLQGVNTAYGVKGCVSNTVCVIIVTHVVTWFCANKDPMFNIAHSTCIPSLVKTVCTGTDINKVAEHYIRKVGLSI